MGRNEIDMREIKALERNSKKYIEVKKHKNIDLVLNFIDTLIEGKRFGEFDSSKQMYLFNCQSRIKEMKLGYYTEEDLEFLKISMHSLKQIIMGAEMEIKQI